MNLCVAVVIIGFTCFWHQYDEKPSFVTHLISQINLHQTLPSGYCINEVFSIDLPDFTV